MSQNYTKPALRTLSGPSPVVSATVCWSGGEAIGGQCSNGGKACFPCHPGYSDYCYPPPEE